MIDTSALVKYYHPEGGSAQVIAIADDPSNVLFISRIGLVEIHSALARKIRTGELQVSAFQQALRRFYADLRRRKFRLIQSPASHVERAHSLWLAMRAPSARAPSFAQAIAGSTVGAPAKVAKPQSTPAMTFSRPTMSA